MRDEPTYEDQPETDAVEFEGDQDDEVDPRGDVDPSEPYPNGDDEEPIDHRADFLDWFDQHFNTVEVSGNRERAPWCPEWWLHPEVNARLWALYQAHFAASMSESMAADSDWWLNHWDRHRAILFDGQTGPFRNCDVTRGHLASQVRHIDRNVVPVTLPPDGWRPPVT